MKKEIFLLATLSLSMSSLMAQDFKSIYPWVPMETSELNKRLVYLTENPNFVSNLKQMDQMGLTQRDTKVQPWGGSFWPLLQGMVANNYQAKEFSSRSSDITRHIGTYFLKTRENTSWKYNYKQWEKRKEKLYPRIDGLTEKELAELAPSEKYDLLMGDKNLTLTNIIWDYTAKRGEDKKIPFLKSIEIPEGYKVGDESKWMAFWEGICHGWAPAAGHYPRPEKTVWVTLADGKRMPFYPNDLKALISLLFANNDLQTDIRFEGLRCDDKKPDKDAYGRYIDKKIYKGNSVHTPNCADVHPGVMHVAIANVLGIEGRSFIFDKDPTAPVANQPASGYELTYFNPQTGKDGSLEQSMVPVWVFPEDPFKTARNSQTRSIVGIEMKLKYIDWENLVYEENNSSADDKVKDSKFIYDLELDARGNIVGGQWRVRKDSKKAGIGSSGVNQPDFFWIIPKDYKKHIQPEPGLPKWDFAKSTIPPQEYGPVAISKLYRLNQPRSRECQVEPIRGRGQAIDVPCITQEPGPQPLVHVIDTLVRESRR